MTAPSTTVALTETFGWHRHVGPDVVAWFKGYVWLDDILHKGSRAAQALASRLPDGIGEAGAMLRPLEGHFALVVERDGAVIAATDRIRSTPLFWTRTSRGVVLDADARRLRDRLADRTIDPQALLELSMAGYVVGPHTLYRDLNQLEAGEIALFGPDRLETRRYFTYDAWKPARCETHAKLHHALVDAHQAMFERLAKGLDGRTVMLPLSGGLDSRLIAAGLAQVGYRNVQCFAYGRPGNFEARKSREVAEHLGFRWRFVPYTPEGVRDFARSSRQAEHDRIVDSCASVPFQQDLYALAQLADARAIPADAVFINGQSGDFITGNHVPAALTTPRPDLDPAARRRRIQDALIAKHFSLWQSLKTEANLACIRSAIDARISAAGVPDIDAEADYGVYELVEYQERQAKFVVSGQRVYEYYGYDWRLPLWDTAYVDFFEKMPLSAKIGQSLYREVLEETNWGGVWRPLLPPRTPSPVWAGHTRRAARAALFFLPQERWKEIDRRYMAYFLDPLCVNSMIPYATYARDPRGARHGVAWRGEAYLARHGVGLAPAKVLAS